MSDHSSIPCFCGISYYFLDETFVVSWHMEKYLTFCRAAKLPLMSSAPKSKAPVHEGVSSEKESAKSKAPLPVHEGVSSEESAKSKAPLPMHEVVSSEKESAKSKAPFPVHEVVSSEKESVVCRKGLCKFITGSSVVYHIRCLVYFICQVRLKEFSMFSLLMCNLQAHRLELSQRSIGQLKHRQMLKCKLFVVFFSAIEQSDFQRVFHFGNHVICY